MPRMDVIERDYEKAVEIVKESYPDIPVGSPQFWSLVFGVVKRMRGRKSARQLQYLGVLSKADDVFGALFYLPYMFQQKVSGVDLLMDLPEPPGKVPPSALPSFPAALGNFVNIMRAGARERGWSETEFADKTIEVYIQYPLIISVNDDDLEDLLTKGNIPLDAVSDGALSDYDIINWKLAWVYAMLTKKIQPLTPRWGYRLAQVTRDIRDLALLRIHEHFSETPARNPFTVYKRVHRFDMPLDNAIVLNGHALLETVKAIVRAVEWRATNVEEYWVSIKAMLSAIAPAWVAYALHAVGNVDVRDVQFLFREGLQSNEVLCAFAHERFVGARNAPFPVLPKPASKDAMVLELRRLVRADATFAELRDEIIATITRRWLV